MRSNSYHQAPAAVLRAASGYDKKAQVGRLLEMGIRPEAAGA